MAGKVIRAIRWPFQSSATSFPAMAEGVFAVQSQLVALLTTGKGERVMRPTVGVNVYEMIFENITPILRARMATDIAQQIQQNLTSLQVLAVDVYEQKQQNGTSAIVVDIRYAMAGQEFSQQIPLRAVVR